MTTRPILGKERARRIAKLATSKERRDTGHMLLDSLPLVDEGLRSGVVSELFVEPGRHEDLALRAENDGVVCTQASGDLLRIISQVQSSPGICAVAGVPAPVSPNEVLNATEFFGVLLDGIADPGNLGTIARSAAAFGATALWLTPGSTDPWSPKALRASSGSLLRLRVSRDVELPQLILGGSEVTVLRAVARGGSDLEDIALKPRRLLWLGNEAHGPSEPPPGWLVDDVTIRLQADVESLNVAAAAAVFLARISAARR